jgi:hypothetical protein
MDMIEPIALIPMEHDFRRQVRGSYTIPFYRNSLILVLFMGGCTFPIIKTAIAGADYNTLWGLLPFALLGLFIYPKIYRHKRHYYKDYQLGYVVKEFVAITKVFDTPSGINIYWLSSDAIKTFVPDPYRIFREGDLLFIYYLQYSKEYLVYER